jgi:hypothetical protein
MPGCGVSKFLWSFSTSMRAKMQIHMVSASLGTMGMCREEHAVVVKMFKDHSRILLNDTVSQVSFFFFSFVRFCSPLPFILFPHVTFVL